MLDGPPEGDYTFVFEVMDTAGQAASTTVSFRVVAQPIPRPPADDSPPRADADPPVDAPAPPDGDASLDDDGLPADYGDDASDELGCRAAGGAPRWAWGPALLLAARRRRARAAISTRAPRRA